MTHGALLMEGALVFEVPKTSALAMPGSCEKPDSLSTKSCIRAIMKASPCGQGALMPDSKRKLTLGIPACDDAGRGVPYMKIHPQSENRGVLIHRRVDCFEKWKYRHMQ